MRIQEYTAQADQRQWQEERRYVRVKCGRWAVRWPCEWTALDVSLAFHPVNSYRRLVWNSSERRIELV
jgi:hypothetical protein